MSKGKRKQAGSKRPLDGSPSHLMHRVLQIALDIYTEETGPGALTQRQYAVLAAVAENEGLTQTDLVNATGIDRSTLADLVARMIGKGLLARERSATDGRANTVRLSAEGRAALDGARPKVEAADKRILSLIPGGKRDSLMKVLGDLAHAGETAKEGAGEKAARNAEKARKKIEREAVKLARKAKKEAARALKAVKAVKIPKVVKAPKALKKAADAVKKAVNGDGGAKPARIAKARKPVARKAAAKKAGGPKPAARKPAGTDA